MKVAMDRSQRTVVSPGKWSSRRSLLYLVAVLVVACSIAVSGTFNFVKRNFTKSDNNEYLSGALATCSDNDMEGVTDTSVTISCRTFEYKAPTEKLKSLEPNTIVFGVLSDSWEGRKAVRQTWGAQSGAEGSSYAVFFLVSSTNFTTTYEKEYNNYQDIIWIGKEDLYLDLTYKTGALVLITDRFLPSDVPYIFKTDTDVYVNVPVLQKHLTPSLTDTDQSSDADSNAGAPIDYYGWCLEPRKPLRPDDHLESWSNPKWALSYEDYPEPYFPPYCIGRGYAMSRSRFLPCAAAHFPTLRYLAFEDTAVGLLAERCNFTYTRIDKKNVGRDEYNTETPGRKVFQHGIKSIEQMKEYHELVVRASSWKKGKKEAGEP
eukprot:CAMPEP_0194031120 /NCGR_PEP_ID=MMETSP0009_2-20130614/4373_1 /TAXON_ID=210454 /ORGANISM="Grammatophora oceanica, Strain CCMP 410" /LENGTH=374 /DNA_ID=CAMNT_0038671191 /DNA_START=380 /DNA_END=1504 /DNA_ORIENTATION=+